MSLVRAVKRWPAWVLLVLVVVGFMAVGTTRDAGPRSEDERIESISKRVACPICDGESVFESRNPSSQSIVEFIGVEVRKGELSDDEIIERITAANQGKERLVPSASGIEALAWALPAAAFVIGVTGLTIAFRRWQEASRQLGAATDDDYQLVAAAIVADEAERSGARHELADGSAGDTHGTTLRSTNEGEDQSVDADQS